MSDRVLKKMIVAGVANFCFLGMSVVSLAAEDVPLTNTDAQTVDGGTDDQAHQGGVDVYETQWEIGSIGDETTLRYGGLDFIPHARVEYEWVDNPSRLEEGGETTQAVVTDVGVEAHTSYRDQQFMLGAEIRTGRYIDSSDDDYVEGDLEATADLVATRRNRFNFLGYYRIDTEERGTGISIGDSLSFERNEELERGVGGDYWFGARDARGGLNLGGGYEERRYLNNEEETFALEYDETEAHMGLRLRASGATSFLLNASHAGTRHLRDDPWARDNDELTLSLAATWSPRARTSFVTEVGQQRRDYINVDEQRTEPYWRVNWIWELYEQTTIRLEGGQEFTESDVLAEDGNVSTFAVLNEYRGSWRQRWLDRVHSWVFYEYRDEYTESFSEGIIERNTYVHIGNISVSYAIQRWLDVGVSVERERQRSDVEGGDYDVDTASVFIQASI